MSDRDVKPGNTTGVCVERGYHCFCFVGARGCCTCRNDGQCVFRADSAPAAHQETLRQLAEVTTERDAIKHLVEKYLRVRGEPGVDLLAILRQEIKREEMGEWMPTYHDWVVERCNAADRAEEARQAYEQVKQLTAERDALKRRVEELERQLRSGVAVPVDESGRSWE